MKPIIFIDPGHSDIDPGAVGFETEFRLNEAVSKYQYEYLKAHFDCEPFLCPSNIDSLGEICRMANEMGAALFVSNHFNAGGGDGFECYVYNKNRVPLGDIFAKHAAAAGQNLRSSNPPGVKIHPYYVLANTSMPAVLTETAFVDNKKDIAEWNDEAELQKMGEAYAKAAAEFLKLEEIQAEEPETEEPERVQTVSMDLPILRQGDTGESVRAVQRLLYSMGYEITKADGIFGPNTYSCVVEYQNDKKLDPDGIVGADTWSKLLGVR